MAVLARPSRDLGLAYQLNALLRARRAVSREQRIESTLSWWLQRLGMWLAASLILLVGFSLGVSAGSDSEVDRSQAAVLFLLGPILWSGYFTFLQVQSNSQGHPLGAGRAFLPLSRRRSAVLAILERVVSPSGAFVWATGLVPWLGAALAGAGWLNPAGWLSVLLFPGLPLLIREVVLGFQRYVVESTKSIAALGGIAITLAAITTPFWIGRLFGSLDTSRLDADSIPVLDVANHPAGPLLVFASAAVLALIAVAVHSAPPLRVRVRRPRLRFALPSLLPALSFHPGARQEVMMARMMVITAVRQPLYLYSLTLLVLLLAAAAIFPGSPGAGLAIFTGYMNPATGFYNLYGGDARHYQLWLATGLRLDEWTRARQLFSLAHIALFGLITAAGLFAVGYIDAAGALAGLFALVHATGLALLLGPAVSRFVLTPWLTDAGGMFGGNRSSRSWVTWATAVTLGVMALSLSSALTAGGLWWVNLVIIGAIAAAYLAFRPDRHPWDPAFRDRLARSFR